MLLDWFWGRSDSMYFSGCFAASIFNPSVTNVIYIWSTYS